MRLPPLPAAGEPITETWGRAVIALLRSLMPKSTTGAGGVIVYRTPSGTTWQAVAQGARGGVAQAQRSLAFAGDVWVDTTANVAKASVTVGYCSIRQDGRADWIKAPTNSGSDAKPAYYDINLSTGVNLVYVQLELVKATGDDTAYDFSGSELAFGTEGCEDASGIAAAIQNIKDEGLTFKKLLFGAIVTAPAEGETAPTVDLLDPAWHTGNWDFTPAMLKKQFCEGDPAAPHDAGVTAVMLDAP
jgi:hypothetical protein